MDAKVIEEMARRCCTFGNYTAAYSCCIGGPRRCHYNKVAQIMWPIARAAALREAAGIIDDRASHLRSAAAADRSRNNPMGGLWYDTRAVEASEHAAALLKEAETTEGK